MVHSICVVTLCIILNAYSLYPWRTWRELVPKVGVDTASVVKGMEKRGETGQMDMDGTPGKAGSQACASSILGQM